MFMAIFAATRVNLKSIVRSITMALRDFCRQTNLTWRRDLAVLLDDAWVSVTATSPV
jgi:hypothetical protein